MNRWNKPPGNRRSASNYLVRDLRNSTLPSTAGWMARLLANKEFQLVPAGNLHKVFARLEPMQFHANQPVFKQGNIAKYFYVLTRGRCEIVRELGGNQGNMLLAELVVGDTFGEEALITGSLRQSTVTMVEDGTVMKLLKEDFKNLLADPIMTLADEEDAQSIITSGGVWLNVDSSMSHRDARAKNSLKIPMPILRHKIDSLDIDRHYVITSSDINHSCAAAHVLYQNGFSVSVLN